MERAAEWIFSHSEVSSAVDPDMGMGTGNHDNVAFEPDLPNGQGSKSLLLSSLKYS